MTEEQGAQPGIAEQIISLLSQMPPEEAAMLMSELQKQFQPPEPPPSGVVSPEGGVNGVPVR